MQAEIRRNLEFTCELKQENRVKQTILDSVFKIYDLTIANKYE